MKKIMKISESQNVKPQGATVPLFFMTTSAMPNAEKNHIIVGNWGNDFFNSTFLLDIFFFH
jgi:hypothetical protein